MNVFIKREYKMFSEAIPKANKNLVEVVRCKECKHHEDFPTGISPLTCSLVWGGVFENDFCSYGQKGDENVETD